MLLHGEETVKVLKPLEVDSTVICQEKVVDLQDKKKAFIIVVECEIKDKESGELLATTVTNLFVRSPAGFGHKGTIKTDYPNAPKRSPDAV